MRGNKKIIVRRRLQSYKRTRPKSIIIIYTLALFFTKMALLKNKIVQILIFALTPFIIAFLVGLTSMGKQYPWYDTINRPLWNPPAWVYIIQKVTLS